MKSVISVVITLVIIIGFSSTSFAYTKKEIVTDLISIAYNGAEEIGLNDIQEDKTKVVSVKINRLKGDFYRAMADIRLYSKKWGEYHIVVHRDHDGNYLKVQTGYAIISYKYGAGTDGVVIYEESLKNYPSWLETGKIPE